MSDKALASDKELFSRLCNLVNGALRACERDHGKIVIGSASKRVVGQLLGALQEGNLLTQSMQNKVSKDLTDLATRLADSEKALRQARKLAIEECAAICIEWSEARTPDGGGLALRNCAEAISALAAKP